MFRLPRLTLPGKRAKTFSVGAGKFFYTAFGATENPISESGVWSHAANTWKTIQTESGFAHAAAFTENFDDAYALLSGWPPNVEVEATVFVGASVDYECELLLRGQDAAGSPGTMRGYEFLVQRSGGGAAFVRWNGAHTSFDIIGSTYSTPTILDGDRLRARIVGNYMQGWRIPVATGVPVLLADATDSTWTDGNPGMSFYVHAVDADLDDVGFTDFAVRTVA